MGAPPCVALTATATPRVQDDIAHQLALRDPARVVTGFNRPNLFFDVRSTPTAKLKRQALKTFLAERAGDPGLIYVATRKECEDLARFIRDEVGRPCEAYHAGLPDRERSDVQEQFVEGSLDLVVATNAFGMGVDRADVRFVAHWSIPSNLESYYQEAGRAGRDRQPASAVLFYAPQDRQLKEWFIDQGVPTLEDLRRVHRYVGRRSAQGEVREESTPYSATDVDFIEEMSEALKIHVSRLPNMLSRLRRAGALSEREGEMGASRWRAEVWDQRAVKGALAAIEKHRDEQMESLFGIVGYAQTGDCRRRRILDHFGDPAETNVPMDQCCDACRVRAHLEGATAPDEIPDWNALPMNSRVALGLLDAVTRMRWPVGRLTLSKILGGSKAKGMEKYERHPYYGRLQTLGQSEVDGIYKQLLMQNYLRMGGGEYPVVELTPLGEQALAHREAIDVEVPAFGSSTSSRSRSVGAAAAVELDGSGDARQAARERRRLLRDAPHGERERRPGEIVGRRAGEQLAQDAAERVDVAARVDVERLARDVLGAHVRERSQDLAGACLDEAEREGLRVERTREPEVDDLEPPFRVDEHVAGLQVAVDDALLMAVVHGLAHAEEELEPLVLVEAREVGVLDQAVGALDVLHDEVGHGAVAVHVGSGVVDLGDAGVAELAEDLGLGAEAAQEVVVGQVRAQRLDRDEPLRVVLLGAVHRSHAAAADHRAQAIRTEACPRGQSGPRRRRQPAHLAGWGEPVAGCLPGGQEPLQLPPNLGCPRALRVEPGFALARGDVFQPVEQLAHVAPGSGIHAEASFPIQRALAPGPAKDPAPRRGQDPW